LKEGENVIVQGRWRYASSNGAVLKIAHPPLRHLSHLNFNNIFEYVGATLVFTLKWTRYPAEISLHCARSSSISMPNPNLIAFPRRTDWKTWLDRLG